MDEIVDIVDEANNVLYQASKREAHEKGLLHRCVVSEVFDSKGCWILVEQASDRQDAGQYVSPVGGHVSSGESEDDALRRETLEEIGLRDIDFTLKGRAIYNRTVIGRKENHYFVLYEMRSDEPFVLNHESVSHRAFTEEELRNELKTNPKRFGAAFFRILEEFYPHML
ncbi:MAG TPA: NUDIX domain-containing protein [Patescibacteria group bacterium]|nr:NUDIX domain-containing protein [Patescibacteria group bacterium]